jgi:hypothetical protein
MQPQTTVGPDLFVLLAQSGITIQSVISIVFLVLFVIWAVYTLVSSYHWLRYGHNSALAIPILVVHVVVSWLLAGYAASGLIG